MLYKRVKARVYKKYPVHSAYRSGILVQEYKKAFRAKYGTRKVPYKGKRPARAGLTRWFMEDWKSDRGKYKYTSKSSVYRPSRRVTKDTPVTWSELTKKEIDRAKRTKARCGRVKRFRA